MMGGEGVVEEIGGREEGLGKGEKEEGESRDKGKKRRRILQEGRSLLVTAGGVSRDLDITIARSRSSCSSLGNPGILFYNSAP